MTPMRDAARVGQCVYVGNGMLGKVTLGPWQWIKDEPLQIHLVVAFVGGKEAEEDHLLLYPRKGRETYVLDHGGTKSMSPRSYTKLCRTKPWCSPNDSPHVYQHDTY